MTDSGEGLRTPTKGVTGTLRRLVLPGVLSCLVLVLLVRAVDPAQFLDALRGANLTLLLLASLKVPADYLILARRWHLILVSGGINVGRRDLWTGVMLGCFFNNVTPGLKVGGDPLKAYYVSRKYGVDFAAVIGGIAAERILQGGVLWITAVTALLASVIARLPGSSIQALVWLTIITTALVALAVYLGAYRLDAVIRVGSRLLGAHVAAHRGRRGDNVEKLTTAAATFRRTYAAALRNRRLAAAVLGLSALQLALAVIQAYLVFRALHADVPVVYVILVTTVVRVSGVVGVTPGGAGVAEGINFGVYSLFRVVSSEILAAQTMLARALDAWVVWISSGVVSAVAAPELLRGPGLAPERDRAVR